MKFEKKLSWIFFTVSLLFLGVVSGLDNVLVSVGAALTTTLAVALEPTCCPPDSLFTAGKKNALHQEND